MSLSPENMKDFLKKTQEMKKTFGREKGKFKKKPSPPKIFEKIE